MPALQANTLVELLTLTVTFLLLGYTSKATGLFRKVNDIQQLKEFFQFCSFEDYTEESCFFFLTSKRNKNLFMKSVHEVQEGK